jgi:hypothetical protein
MNLAASRPAARETELPLGFENACCAKRLKFSMSNSKYEASMFYGVAVCNVVLRQSLFATVTVRSARTTRRAQTRLCFRTSIFLAPRASGPKTTPQTLQKQTKALNQPWIRSAAANASATPQAKDAPTDTLHPRIILMAERRPLDSLVRLLLPNSLGESWAAANQCVWPVEPTQNWAGQSTHAYSSLRIDRCQGSCRGRGVKIGTFSHCRVRRPGLARACRQPNRGITPCGT